MSDTVTAYELGVYLGSRDYYKLTELACQASIICLVDHNGQREVARTNYSRRGEQVVWSVCSRGIAYITAFNGEDFVALCRHRNLEFLAPVKPKTR